MKIAILFLTLAALAVAETGSDSGSDSGSGSGSDSGSGSSTDSSSTSSSSTTSGTSDTSATGTLFYPESDKYLIPKGEGGECRFGHKHDCLKGFRCLCPTTHKSKHFWHKGQIGTCQKCSRGKGSGEKCKPYHGECAKEYYCHRDKVEKHGTKKVQKKRKNPNYNGYSGDKYITETKEVEYCDIVTNGTCQPKKPCDLPAGAPCKVLHSYCGHGLKCKSQFGHFHGRCEARKGKYGADGYSKKGYNEKGYNKTGYNKHGYNDKGYNAEGYNAKGYNAEGYNKGGYSKEGYNKEGYNKKGYNKEGYNAAGYDHHGYGKGGYNKEGYNKEGYNAEGYNRKGYNKGGKKKGEY